MLLDYYSPGPLGRRMETDWGEENGMEGRLGETEGRGGKRRTVEEKEGQDPWENSGGTLHSGRTKEIHEGRGRGIDLPKGQAPALKK